ncbi:MULTISPECIES: hypothetical protein [unclassified Crossiella]|uniref:hypothetical protein n=1 Tax=unclassified Crossiella TaxID=2620835 RepID=UPI001FFFF491|nr:MULTISPECIES: hypothetical protein [unclassified Crossiella]MCK2236938.1 hypothetical protein [Crossiella sp. S99.2]MCK2250606.1 hypothetical protein [Crossiella sp. S99.1]
MNLDRVRAAAFGDRPADNVFAEAAAGGWAAWYAAVALGGQGYYAAALTTLTRLGQGRDPVLAAAAWTALASHRRQLGAHTAAAGHDGEALRRLAQAGLYPLTQDTIAPPSPESLRSVVVDVLLGLAADAIGRGRLSAAARLHGEAVLTLGSDPGWRPRVRIGWVAAEIALAQGAPHQALPASKHACDLAHTTSSVRHQTKSGLVLGVTQQVLGLPTGVDFLRRVIKNGGRHGLLPLVWPSALLLSEAEPDRVGYHRNGAREALTTVLGRTDASGRRLAARSAWLPSWLLRSSEPGDAASRMNFLTD